MSNNNENKNLSNEEPKEFRRTREFLLKQLDNILRERAFIDTLLIHNLAEYVESFPTGDSREVDMHVREVAMQIGAVMKISDRTAEKYLDHADTLINKYPDVVTALHFGKINLQSAFMIVEQAFPIKNRSGLCEECEPNIHGVVNCVCGYQEHEAKQTAEAIKIYGEKALKEATKPNMSIGRLKYRLQKLANSLTSLPIEERQKETLAQHQWQGLKQIDLGSGVVESRFVTDAVTAQAIKSRVRNISELKVKDIRNARKNKKEIPQNGESFQIGVLECETMTEIILGRLDYSYSHVKGEVKIIVPALTLETGASKTTLKDLTNYYKRLYLLQNTPGLSGPAQLDGYGPVSATTYTKPTASEKRKEVLDNVPGRDFVQGITLTDVLLKTNKPETLLIHPTKGHILSTKGYVPNKIIRDFLEIRDEHCRFPGCMGRVSRADADHTIAWSQGGTTNTSNLALLCRRHHTAKHHTGWSVKQVGEGYLEWKTPDGTKIVDDPEAHYPQIPFKYEPISLANLPEDEPPPF